MSDHRQFPPNIREVEQWHVLKVENGHKVLYRLLSATSDHFYDRWRLNSGIINFFINDDYIDFHGYSGSIYRCNLFNEGFSNLTKTVLTNWQAEVTDPGHTIRVIKFNDFLTEWESHKPRLS